MKKRPLRFANSAMRNISSLLYTVPVGFPGLQSIMALVLFVILASIVELSGRAKPSSA